MSGGVVGKHGFINCKIVVTILGMKYLVIFKKLHSKLKRKIDNGVLASLAPPVILHFWLKEKDI